MTVREYTLEVYKDRKREWRWRLVHRNAKIVAESGEGYSRRRDCLAEARKILKKGPALGGNLVGVL